MTIVGLATVIRAIREPRPLQRRVKARTVHDGYGAEMRELRRLMRALYRIRRGT